MKCTNCGFESSDEARYCEKCGASLAMAKFAPPSSGAYGGPYTAPAPTPTEYPSPARTANTASDEPAGFWSFFGLIFLFAIPVVGWIACIVCCFAPENRSLKNYARAHIAWKAVGTVVSVILSILLVIFAGDIIRQKKSSGELDHYLDEIREEYVDDDIDDVDDIIDIIDFFD